MRNIHLQIAPAKSVSPPPLATSILLRKITFLLQITRGRSFRKKGEGKKNERRRFPSATTRRRPFTSGFWYIVEFRRM